MEILKAHSFLRMGLLYFEAELISGGYDDAESGFAAHHAIVGFGGAFQREGFVHGADAAEDAESESVLRVNGSASSPAFHGLAPAEKLQRRNFERRHSADNCESSVYGEAADYRFHRVGIGNGRKDDLSAAKFLKFGGGILRLAININ